MTRIDGEFIAVDQRFDVAMARIDAQFADVRKSFLAINERFNMIDAAFAEIKEKMYTKQDHARDMVWMDKAMAEIDAAREERLLSGRQSLRVSDRIDDHEKRIRILEKRAGR
jgi:hypothetical protein